MKAWSVSWNTATASFDKFRIVQIRRTGKGCLSYLLISGEEGMVVDASLPVEVYERMLLEEGVSLKFTIDTHIHADHLSRSKELADKFRVPYYLPPQDRASFDFRRLEEDIRLQVGDVFVKAIHTPGHTLESTCLLIDGKVLLTGDTLFIDSIGRPDLKLSPKETRKKATLLYHSLQKLMSMNESIIVMPGHTSKPVDFDKIPVMAHLSSIKDNVKMLNLAEDDFVGTLLRRIPPTPPNYLSIVEKNISGDYADAVTPDLEAGANRCAIF